MSRWGTPLLIARRTVRRNIGRSLLVAVLVGLPVAGATFVDVLIRSFDNNERSAYQEMGPADAELTVTNKSSLRTFSPMAYQGYYGRPGHGDRNPDSVDLISLLPAGSTWIDAPRTYEARVSYDGDRITRPPMTVVDAASPLAAHTARLTEGQFPRTPDEVTVTRPLADRLGLIDSDGQLAPDATLTLVGGPTASVTGLVTPPFCLDCEEFFTAPGSTLAETVKPGQDYSALPRRTYLVDLPDGVSAESLWRPLAADAGIAMTPRAAYVHPEDYGATSGGAVALTSAANLRAAALALLVTGLGLLEVVLLAGTAFAVGARRQIHDLGVISATGATARQIRRIVLAQGLVLGLLGSALGIAFGAAVAVAGRGFWEHLANGIVLGWSFGLWEILIAALVGAASGLLAAVVPAIGAGRMTAVDALSGRFRVSKAGRRRTPILGAALVVVGIATGVLGDKMMAADFVTYVRRLARANAYNYVTPPSPTVPVALVLAGAVFAVVGMVVLAPVLITAIGRSSGRLPLSGRLAFRDASRHRHRTGPATSAIAVAVSGSVVLAFVVAGRAEADRLSYTAYLPPHVFSVDRGDASTVDQAVERAASILPGSSVVRPEQVVRHPPPQHPREVRSLYVLPRRCPGGCPGLFAAAADPDVMALVLGRSVSADEQAALDAGKALVLTSSVLDKRGLVTIDQGRRGIQLPAVVAHVDLTYGSLPGVFVSRAVIDEHHWGTLPVSTLIPFDASATQSQIDDAKTAIEEEGAYYSLDTGPSDPSRILLIIAAIAAGFVTLVGVAISVALSAAEGRADLATLAAVGAPPRRRRSLAAAQALLVGGLGCGLGLLLGVFVSYTLRATIGAPGFVVPWNNLVTVGIVVPIMAMLIAAVFTPSRLPLTVRRPS